MTYDSSQTSDLSPEDQYRISRLYEEIRSRLLEIALIGSRVMNFELTSDMVLKFEPAHEAAQDRSYDVDVEIICPPPELGACACIYRGEDGQWHYERPCGSTHH